MTEQHRLQIFHGFFFLTQTNQNPVSHNPDLVRTVGHRFFQNRNRRLGIISQQMQTDDSPPTHTIIVTGHIRFQSLTILHVTRQRQISGIQILLQRIQLRITHHIKDGQVVRFRTTIPNGLRQ